MNMVLTGHRPVVVLGSSDAEVFDYLFGQRADYFPFWASGWSARGLRSDIHARYLRKILRNIPREANVFLNFGYVDVNFNCRHMASEKGVYDFPRIIEEASEGILSAATVVRALGFRSVRAAFVSPAIALPQKYWSRFSPARQLPDKVLGLMYYDLFKRVSEKMPTIDIFDVAVNPETFLLRRKYMRAKTNHHSDYIAIQELVWNTVRNLPGILPPRYSPISELYPHTSAGITDLIRAGIPRANTCM